MKNLIVLSSSLVILVIASACSSSPGGGSGGMGGSSSSSLAGVTYTVTYYGNGNQSGSVPIDNNQYSPGATVIVQGNNSNMTMDNCNFAGWTTSTNWPEISYAPGATFSMATSNISLYAVWINNCLTFSSYGTSIVLTGYTSSLSPKSPNRNFFPLGVTGIISYAFESCPFLPNPITIPNSLSYIGDVAFEYCNILISITIPSSVTNLGQVAFRYCYRLQNVVISNSISSIEEGTFYYCTNLTSVIIPGSVTNIGIWAFESCTSLSNVYVNATNPPALIWDSSSGSYDEFSNCPANMQIHVPAGSVGDYQTSPGWSLYTIVTP
jgi:hypothetical protein